MIWLDEKLAAHFSHGKDMMNQLFAIQGEIFREPEGANRRTLRFKLDGSGYFLKLHWGVGWREIFKNLFTFKAPVLGASNEWLAIKRLDELGIETMKLAGYGEEGVNPAGKRSFVITNELTDTISLEDYSLNWKKVVPSPRIKWVLIKRVAEMTARMHANGMNHRDLYICHFLLSQPWDGDETKLHLYLIDLHRVQIRNETPVRWQIKDLAALYFSSLNIGLTRRDLYRFVKHYTGLPLRDALSAYADLWQKVTRRGDKLNETKPVILPE